jgi:hypothetical protein
VYLCQADVAYNLVSTDKAFDFAKQATQFSGTRREMQVERRSPGECAYAAAVVLRTSPVPAA